MRFCRVAKKGARGGHPGTPRGAREVHIGSGAWESPEMAPKGSGGGQFGAKVKRMPLGAGNELSKVLDFVPFSVPKCWNLDIS